MGSPEAARDKIGYDISSSSSDSFVAHDVCSDDLEDDEGETIETNASTMRMQKAPSSSSINSIGSTTASFDHPLITTRTESVGSPSSVYTLASIENLDILDVRLGAVGES